MGAVKTNRREKALYWSNYIEPHYGIVQKYDRFYMRNERLYPIMESDCNNRRKMAGERMIRRAKS